jgi:ATP-dependent protease Clp ATPase subunit
VLLDVMYEVPSHPEAVKCVVNAECITRHTPPLLLMETGQAVAWGEYLSEKAAS